MAAGETSDLPCRTLSAMWVDHVQLLDMAVSIIRLEYMLRIAAFVFLGVPSDWW